jgi:hypothetical protein
MHDPEDEALIQEILPVLEVDHQYTRLVEAWNHQLVAQIRRCGRQAGKRLGSKIRTLTSDRNGETTDDSQSGSSSSVRTPPTRIASASEATS